MLSVDIDAAASPAAAPQPSITPTTQAFDQQTRAQLKKRGFTYLADKNNWVYYDNNGNSLKGEQGLFDGMYYFDKKTGALSFGLTTLDDGKQAYHNDITCRALHGASAVENNAYAFNQSRGIQSFDWMDYKGYRTYADPRTGVITSGGQKTNGAYLVFMYYSNRGPEHVMLYAGSGMFYEEPDFGGHCQYVSLASKNAWDATERRILSY